MTEYLQSNLQVIAILIVLIAGAWNIFGNLLELPKGLKFLLRLEGYALHILCIMASIQIIIEGSL